MPAKPFQPRELLLSGSVDGFSVSAIFSGSVFGYNSFISISSPPLSSNFIISNVKEKDYLRILKMLLCQKTKSRPKAAFDA